MAVATGFDGGVVFTVQPELVTAAEKDRSNLLLLRGESAIAGFAAIARVPAVFARRARYNCLAIPQDQGKDRL
jgi:hypothetical protein